MRKSAHVSLLGRLTGRLRFRSGAWWSGRFLCSPCLHLPMVGNPIKRAPGDPFLILLAALTPVALAERLGASNRLAWSTRAVRHNAGGG